MNPLGMKNPGRWVKLKTTSVGGMNIFLEPDIKCLNVSLHMRFNSKGSSVLLSNISFLIK